MHESGILSSRKHRFEKLKTGMLRPDIDLFTIHTEEHKVQFPICGRFFPKIFMKGGGYSQNNQPDSIVWALQRLEMLVLH